MQSGTFFQKVFAIVMYVGIFFLLHRILKVVVLGVTLYVTYFIYAFNGGTDPATFREGTMYALLIWIDYVLAIFLAAYFAWKIGKCVLRMLFPSKCLPNPHIEA